MAPIRPGNKERKFLTEEIRQQLSTHIRTKLGIRIDPAKIRLDTKGKEPYTWAFFHEKEEILKKIFCHNISELTLTQLRVLHNQVGETFEAVAANNGPGNLGSITGWTLQPVNFTTSIEQLKDENERLSRETRRWKEKAHAALESNHAKEEEKKRADDERELLQIQAEAHAASADYYRQRVSACYKGLDAVLQMVEELRNTVNLNVQSLEST